jgi:RNA polymerase sigma factor (sigma-70 family)
MLMAGAEIAKNHASRLLGIDEADATQQVSVYLLDSIRRYDPDYRTDQGKRVKLCTYAYSRSEKLIKEWVLTNSRLVRIPRSKMERILIVVRAYDAMESHSINLAELVAGANGIVKERRGKLTLTSAFDIDEVDDLIKILLSSYVHLDQPYKKSNRANQPTIGDMLVNQDECVIDTIEECDRREQLYEVMQEHLTTREFQVIMLRYFHDPTHKVPRALTEVGALLVSVYGGTDYSRESIRLLEKSALAKLQDVEEIRELWKD